MRLLYCQHAKAEYRDRRRIQSYELRQYVREIPTAQGDPRGHAALAGTAARSRKNATQEIRAVFTGESGKFVLIIGPCSAHDEDAVCDYISRLAKVQAEVKDKILIIPRIYTNKPRTTGIGYKGMAHQPNLQEEPNIVEGIKAIRKMHIRALKESHLPAADEMLYPGNYPYLEDVLSYVAVGARSVENQAHRLTCSGLDIPVGMKNPTSGDIEVTLNSIQAAQAPHVFSYNRWEVKTSGNPLTHAVLRGAVDYHGMTIPNYHYEDLMTVRRGLPEARPYQSGHHRGHEPRQLEQEVRGAAPDRHGSDAEPPAFDAAQGHDQGFHDRELHRGRQPRR